MENKGKLILTDPFLPIFYYVEKLNEILLKIGGRGLKILTYSYMGGGEIKNCQNHPCVIDK